ncbi:MAG: hypothetical protein Q8Q89_04790 [bacterium]|nr:hypothetical protein [bacterium]
MEPNIKRIRIKRCASKKEANRELIKGLLGNEPLTFQLLFTILISDPYNLSRDEVNIALNELNGEGFLKIKKFDIGAWMTVSCYDIVLALAK